MEDRIPTINQELINAIKEEEQYQNGDIYDEDLGEYLATIDLRQNEEKVETIPAKLSVFMHGYWYIFTPVGRYKEGTQIEKQE